MTALLAYNVCITFICRSITWLRYSLPLLLPASCTFSHPYALLHLNGSITSVFFLTLVNMTSHKNKTFIINFCVVYFSSIPMVPAHLSSLLHPHHFCKQDNM